MVDSDPPYDDDEYGDLAALDVAGADDAVEASDLDALDFSVVHESEDHADEPPIRVFTVTNPPGTVTVTTFLDGQVKTIDLSSKAAQMAEADLADEIVVIAHLANQAARSAQHAYMLEGMRQQGHDDVATRDFLVRDLDLPTPESAEAARAHVFATRYAGDHE